MTAQPLLTTLLPLVADLSRDLPEGERYRRLLQDTAVVISQFQTAAAAGQPPDIQFLWNGIYHMESVWLGYLSPLEGLIPDEVIKDSNPTLLSRFGGKTYRLGWYALPMIWIYNKAAFQKAGVDEPVIGTSLVLAGIGVDRSPHRTITPPW